MDLFFAFLPWLFYIFNKYLLNGSYILLCHNQNSDQVSSCVEGVEDKKKGQKMGNYNIVCQVLGEHSRVT